MNQTLTKFGYPSTLIAEYTHWVVLQRPKQVTVGSLILAAKADCLSFSTLPSEAFREFGHTIRDIELSLRHIFAFDKINYLALMMVDPNPHYHVLPRYSKPRELNGAQYADTAWPGPPDLSRTLDLTASDDAALLSTLRQGWQRQG